MKLNDRKLQSQENTQEKENGMDESSEAEIEMSVSEE